VLPHPSLERLVAAPQAAAVLLDVDGTLAPIVGRPEDAGVPAETLALLARVAERYGLTGCVSGRRAADAARLVPVPGLVFAGNHGLEILDGDAVETAPEVDPYLPALRRLVRVLTPLAAGVGGFLEDKGATLSVHYRRSPDPAAARQALERDAVAAIRDAGLEARFGRMVLEARPPVAVDKGSAVRRLLRGRRVACSLYAGDDRTDLDAFRVVDVAVAVRSAEAPPELEDAATFAVDGTDGVRELLRALVA
jgi:trehalose 6-phosphate phosphatase